MIAWILSLLFLFLTLPFPWVVEACFNVIANVTSLAWRLLMAVLRSLRLSVQAVRTNVVVQQSLLEVFALIRDAGWILIDLPEHIEIWFSSSRRVEGLVRTQRCAGLIESGRCGRQKKTPESVWYCHQHRRQAVDQHRG